MLLCSIFFLLLSNSLSFRRDISIYYSRIGVVIQLYFISIYLSIELQSYGLYLLCTMYRNSESSTSSGLTYFLLGGLSSCFILLGIGLIYANSGTTYLDNFYIITNLSNIINGEEQNNLIYGDIVNYIPYCLLLITIGFLFKI